MGGRQIGKVEEQIKAQERKIKQISRVLEGLQRMYKGMPQKTPIWVSEGRLTAQMLQEDIQFYIDRLKDEMDVLGAFHDVLEKSKKQGDNP